MATIYLFTGENTYAVREEKMRWIGQFRKKHGEENLIRLEGKGLDMRLLLDEISAAPFLAESRLVIVDGVPKCTKEDIDMLERVIHPKTVLLFADASPDKRLAGTKALLKSAEVKEFKALQPAALRQWAEALTREAGSSLEQGAFETLLELVGKDQDMLAEEVKKLSLLAAPKPVTRDLAEEMGVPSDEGVVWRMTDLLSAGNRLEAARFAKTSIARGGDAYGMWAILLNSLKNLVAVSAAVQAGETDPTAIASKTGVHPFALRSMLPYARRTDAAKLRVFLDRIVEDDIALKTGTYKATDESPEEIVSLIDRFILTSP